MKYFLNRCIMMHNVCAVHWVMFSTMDGYHEYSGGIPCVQWRVPSTSRENS